MPRDKAQYHLFSDSYRYYGRYRQPTEISVIRYNREKIEKEEVYTGTEDFGRLAKEGYINWIHVSGLADSAVITRLIETMGFPPVDCKPVLTPLHAAKIDLSNDRLIIIMRACYFEKKRDVSSEHIAVLSRDNFVITFREKREKDLFVPVENSIVKDVMGIRSSNTTMLVSFLMNAVFSVTIETALKVEDMLEKLDDELLETLKNDNAGRKIQQCRHATLILHKNNTPLHREFTNFAQSDAVVSDESMMQIVDELSNQLDLIILTAVNCSDMLTSMRDMYAANNEFRTNAIMKRLTIVSTLFIPITFLVGLWGMNFKYMPELDLEFGYPLALIALFLTGVWTWEFMKRNKWF